MASAGEKAIHAALKTRVFDPVYGGIQRAPKFPSNMPVRLLP